MRCLAREFLPKSLKYPIRYLVLNTISAIVLMLPFEVLQRIHLLYMLHHQLNKPPLDSLLYNHRIILRFLCIASPWQLLSLEWLAFLLQKIGVGFSAYLDDSKKGENNRFSLQKKDRLFSQKGPTLIHKESFLFPIKYCHLYNTELQNLEDSIAFLKPTVWLHVHVMWHVHICL